MYGKTFRALALAGALCALPLAGAWAQLATDLVCSGCVGAGDLADQAVTGNKLGNGSILTSKYADGSVTGNKLGNGSILTGKFADQSVTGNKIAQGAILTGKLAIGAVRTSKIADAAVTNAKIANFAVTSTKLGDGAVTNAKIANGAVTGAKIDNLAITGGKLADGTITAAKLAPGVIDGGAGLVRTLVVSPVGDGSDTEANGFELLDALAFLDTVSPLPSATNPWLIGIEPGIYDIGSETVLMKPFVDIAGSGREVTEIISSNGNSNSPTIRLAGNTELRSLSVVNKDASGSLRGLLGDDVSNLRLTDLRVTAISTDATSIIGMWLEDISDLTITNVESNGINSVTGQSIGIFVLRTTSELVNVTALASTGALSEGFLSNAGTTTIRNSILLGDNGAVQNTSPSVTNIVSTQINNGANNRSGSGTFTCVGSYDQFFVALTTSCL